MNRRTKDSVTPTTCKPGRRFKNEQGNSFGQLTVLSCAGKRDKKNAPYYWRCVCSCGAKLEVSGTSLRTGTSTSCGHARRTHGGSHLLAYASWRAMWHRTMNPNSHAYPRYGGAGITLCVKWRSFEGFLEDMGERLPGMSIERKNGNKGYNKRNCVWANRTTQSRNRRHLRKLTYKGKSQCLTAWCEELNLPVGRVKSRLRYGWSVKKALETPPMAKAQR